MNLIYKKPFRLLLASGLLICACAPTVLPPLVDPSLSIASLRQSITAILPIGVNSTIRNTQFPDARRVASERVNQQLVANLAGVRFKSVAETTEVLQQSNLIESYANTLVALEQTGILNGARISEIGKKLEAKYVVVAILQSMETIPGPQFCIETYRVTFTILIFDSSLSKTVFEGSGRGSSANCLFSGQTPYDAVNAAVNDASGVLIRNIK